MLNKTILICGQSGTFGTAMTKKLLELYNVKSIIGFDRDEKNQYLSKQKIDDKRIVRVIGDIRDKEAVDNVMKTYKPDIVMLASAMKHIDKCEAYPNECRKTNIDGCINVINSFIDYGAENGKLVFLSTDKATSPTTIYGCSKLFVEMYIQAVDSKDKTLLITRYGNVLGSNGSVLDIWRNQKAKGEPLTVTNPQMSRFFMSIEQAVDLVLWAVLNGNDKDLCVYNNKSCTIGELADCISKNQVEVGLRCVEKNDEALLTVYELNHSKRYGEYFVVNKMLQNENEHTIPFQSDTAERLTKEELKEMIDNV